ncbi:MAG: hypothetical protein HYX78_13605 [Armatimonadetes bacterium]|nr:hypothetical protein [Armatimonadota bacterium]
MKNERRRSAAGLRSLILALALVLAAGCIAAGQQPVATGTQIPIIINIYKNAGISPADAKAAIEEASKIAAQAGYKLTVVKVNENATGGDADENGDIAPAEVEKVVKAGKDEIEKTPNKKGVKVSFTRTPLTGSTTPGWTYHDKPVMVVKNRGSSEATGQTIAHELGHILTLGPRHKVDNRTDADGVGHTPNRAGDSGNGNIMAPSNRRNGTKLTQDQIDEMKKKRFERGKCASQWDRAYGASKDKHQHGVRTDDLGDQAAGSPAHADITTATLNGINGDPVIWGQIALGGTFAESSTVNTRYVMVFNSDNDTSTGSIYGPFEGVEYALQIRALKFESGELMIFPANVTNLMDGEVVPLPEKPTVTNAEWLTDTEGLGGQTVYNYINFTLPKEMVGIPVGIETGDATEVPVGVLSEEVVSGIVADESSLVFNLDQWLRDPTLETFGNGVPTPGQPYPFAISGLQPNDIFNLYVDETLVKTGVLDETGGFGPRQFIFPSDLSNNHMHFLTAQDSTGEFAYNITCPEPVTTVAEAKSLSDQGLCSLDSLGVSAAFGDIFYVQTDDRSSGIAVYGPGSVPPTGLRTNVLGVIRTNSDGERYIEASAVEPVDEDVMTQPLGMNNRAIGGGDLFFDPITESGQMGVTDGSGLNNIGLLVRTAGRIVDVEDDVSPTWFRIDDGSGRSIKCLATADVSIDPTWLDRMAVVTGVSSMERNEDNEACSVIRLRSQNDVLFL